MASNSNKKVLYISYDGMTDPLGQSQVLPYIIGLTKEGYEFHLISFEKIDRFKTHHRHIRSICAEHNIHWHPQDYQLKGGLLKTIKQVRRLNKVVKMLHRTHQFSIVHCRSYISALSGLKLKRKHDVKFVFDMRGFWANERVDGKIWNLDNFLYKQIYNFFKRKEIQFFRESDYTISLTENGRNEIESWDAFSDQKPKIKVIPCCVNLELFDPTNITIEDQTALKAKLGIDPTDFVLGYIGSIGTWYMLDEMLDYYKELQAKNPTAKFLFVSGEPPEMITSECEKKGISLDQIIITSTLHKDVPLHISIFDSSVFFIRASYSKKASSPTKQGEIMAMGIPLVCNSGVGDTDEIVERYKAGIVIKDFTPESYRAAFTEDHTFDIDGIKTGANDYFSLTEGVSRYLSVYKAIDA